MFSTIKQLSQKMTVMSGGLLLAGCVSMGTANLEPPHVYLLEGQIENTGHARTIPLTLLVSKPHAAPGFDSVNMAYVRHPHEIEYFTKHQWAETPAKMLWPLLVDNLEKQSGYRSVIPAAGLVKGDVRLDLEIVQLQQEFSVPKSRINIKLRVQLIDQNTYRVLATQTFEGTEITPSEDPYGGVIAANRALKPLLRQIADFSRSQGTQFFEQKKPTQ